MGEGTSHGGEVEVWGRVWDREGEEVLVDGDADVWGGGWV